MHSTHTPTSHLHALGPVEPTHVGPGAPARNGHANSYVVGACVFAIDRHFLCTQTRWRSSASTHTYSACRRQRRVRNRFGEERACERVCGRRRRVVGRWGGWRVLVVGCWQGGVHAGCFCNYRVVLRRHSCTIIIIDMLVQ